MALITAVIDVPYWVANKNRVSPRRTVYSTQFCGGPQTAVGFGVAAGFGR